MPAESSAVLGFAGNETASERKHSDKQESG